MKLAQIAVGLAGIGASAAAALADVTVTQSAAAAPTYATTLNFDEPGGPTGAVSTDAWLASHGISELQAGDGFPFVDDFTAGQPWIGAGNAFFGSFGVFLTLADDATEMSMQIWDPSGPGGPFGGGFIAIAFDDGAEVGSHFGTPAWGGIGDSWINITTNGGSRFDEVRVLGFGFFPTTYADNLSWNSVPEPGSLALLGLAAVAALRRARR